MARTRVSPSVGHSSTSHAAPHHPSSSRKEIERTPHPPSSHTAAATQQPQVTNVYVQRGGGGGSGILGTMAAVAGGSVLGHGISNYLYGQSNQAPQQPAEAQELAKTAAQEGNACSAQLEGYSKCLEANPGNPESCKWAWDYFLQCRDKNCTPSS